MAYKVFTNGSPLSASDLNTYLMNQSVMVFATATTRSGTLTSPTEGMVTYLEDTNKVEVWTGSAWVDINDNSAAIPKSTVTTAGDLIIADGSSSVTRLGIGANGRVLTSNGTTATWELPAVGGSQNWQSIASGSITTGAAAFNITSITAYDKYLLLINGLSSSSSSAEARFRINNDSTTKYSYAGFFWQGTTLGQEASFNDAYFPLGVMGNAASSVISAGIIITGAQNSGSKSINMLTGASGSTTNNGRSFNGVYKGTSAITQLNIVFQAGTIDAGTYELWGSN